MERQREVVISSRFMANNYCNLIGQYEFALTNCDLKMHESSFFFSFHSMPVLVRLQHLGNFLSSLYDLSAVLSISGNVQSKTFV